MANLKEIRTRISSVESTMQITSAMKMVSAAKLKRAQNAITQMRPFANKFNEILLNVSSSVDGGEYPLMNKTNGKKVLFIALTSNRGLCGGFNNNVINKYQNSEIYYDTNQDYIINFPKIILYLLEIKNYNLLKWICQEHSLNYPNFQYPDNLIEILLDSNYTYDDNLIKKSLWKFLYLFGYDFYEFKYSDHYIIERMRNEANCSYCFGLDPNC